MLKKRPEAVFSPEQNKAGFLPEQKKTELPPPVTTKNKNTSLFAYQ